MTKSDLERILKFALLMLVVLSLAFYIHSEVLANFLHTESQGLVKAYTFNGLFTVAVFATLIYLKEKHNNIIGFLFIGGSFLKFILFFVSFYPVYSADEVITRVEFSEFFIPYLIALFLEVFMLIKVLMLEE
ncbi:MAG: hypothetical protein AB8B53_01110 [Flavobacteriales bacterium]